MGGGSLPPELQRGAVSGQAGGLRWWDLEELGHHATGPQGAPEELSSV